jgi:thiamine biosynthesis protein ThiI
MQPAIILHHHEIILKGNNRGFFERQLLANVRAVLAGLVPANAVGGGYGRFIVLLEADSAVEEIVRRLSTVFGIANVCTGVRTVQDVRAFSEAAEQLLAGGTFRSVKVDTRRADKNFPVRSMEVNAQVGAFVCERFGVRADMTHPDETVYISINDGAAYVYVSKVKGMGGLPAGVSGRVVSLLSAGFDSPVASWQMMKRGASVIFAHFHSMPYTSREAVAQVEQLAALLTQYQLHSRLYLIPFADVQNQIVLSSPQHLRIILYRRMMIRIADAIARREKAEALVTGEALGQVASQTLRNIRAIDEAATYPILRPLAGADKEETMAVARRIGTFDISKEPYDDCCSFLAPRKPETWASLEEVASAESALDIPALTSLALGRAELQLYHYPPKEAHAPAPAPL